jgi:hypothetical protein
MDHSGGRSVVVFASIFRKAGEEGEELKDALELSSFGLHRPSLTRSYVSFPCRFSPLEGAMPRQSFAAIRGALLLIRL